MVVDLQLTDDEVDRLFHALADATRRDILRRVLARARQAASWSSIERGFCSWLEYRA